MIGYLRRNTTMKTTDCTVIQVRSRVSLWKAPQAGIKRVMGSGGRVFAAPKLRSACFLRSP